MNSLAQQMGKQAAKMGTPYKPAPEKNLLTAGIAPLAQLALAPGAAKIPIGAALASAPAATLVGLAGAGAAGYGAGKWMDRKSGGKLSDMGSKLFKPLTERIWNPK